MAMLISEARESCAIARVTCAEAYAVRQASRSFLVSIKAHGSHHADPSPHIRRNETWKPQNLPLSSRSDAHP